MMYVMLVGRAPFDTRGVRENILNKVVTGQYEVRIGHQFYEILYDLSALSVWGG